MDYVEWCDSIATAMADYAERQYDHSVHIHVFARDFVVSRRLVNEFAAEDAVILDSAELLSVIGLDNDDLDLQFKRADLARLRDSYSRWIQAYSYNLDDISLVLLGVLNRLSQSERQGYTTVEEVDLARIVDEASRGAEGMTIDLDHAEEIFDDLVARGLAHPHKTMDTTRYKSSYLGAARLARARVAQDQEIDALRTAGEGDMLDFKRIYKLKSNAEKHEFAKDVTAMANAGGASPRYLLIGVEDNGAFFAPASAEAATEHREALNGINDARLQEILNSRTTRSPSVRISARGDHRDGPYLLIEITRDINHLPFRVYQDQAERTAHNAHDLGEVWVRKGTTKARATAAEIAALEQQADLFRRIRT